jgi:hypothetical protein
MKYRFLASSSAGEGILYDSDCMAKVLKVSLPREPRLFTLHFEEPTSAKIFLEACVQSSDDVVQCYSFTA